MKKSLLYLMHVDWDWIFQRPHIFSLKLEEKYNVTTAYQYKIFNRKNLKKNKIRPTNEYKLFQVPKEYQYYIPRMVNGIINLYYKNKIEKKQYDYIWLCHPRMLKFVPDNYLGTIIYDCMDMHSEMTNNSFYKEMYQQNEEEILSKSDIVLASSSVIKNELLNNITSNKNVYLIRNGYSNNQDVTAPKKTYKKDEYTIGYIGTISSWFDFDSLFYSLEKNKQITYHLIGPFEENQNIKNPKIHLEGIIKHEELPNKVKNYDCLIMPFKVNNIILAVDPVKLYEYISYGKCIISIYYPEIERFSDFVYFYTNSDELNKIIKKKSDDGFKPKYSEKQQREFLMENSWENRINEIFNLMGSS